MSTPTITEFYDEHEVIARGLGKWSDADIPKAGWHCERIFDLGKGTYRVCEMCETVHIRFVHVMVHGIGLRLESGCICAGHMAENLVAARARDDDIQKAANRVSRRAAALDKATREQQRLEIGTGDDIPLSEKQESLSKLERLKRLAQRRYEAAQADANAYDCYANEVAKHIDFLRDINALLDLLQIQISKAQTAVHQQILAQNLRSPDWRPTTRGFRFISIDGDRVQVFMKDGHYRGMYHLKGEREPVWSKRKFGSANEAKEVALAVLQQQLRKLNRLPGEVTANDKSSRVASGLEPKSGKE